MKFFVFYLTLFFAPGLLDARNENELIPMSDDSSSKDKRDETARPINQCPDQCDGAAFVRNPTANATHFWGSRCGKSPRQWVLLCDKTPFTEMLNSSAATACIDSCEESELCFDQWDEPDDSTFQNASCISASSSKRLTNRRSYKGPQSSCRVGFSPHRSDRGGYIQIKLTPASRNDAEPDLDTFYNASTISLMNFGKKPGQWLGDIETCQNCNTLSFWYGPGSSLIEAFFILPNRNDEPFLHYFFPDGTFQGIGV